MLLYQTLAAIYGAKHQPAEETDDAPNLEGLTVVHQAPAKPLLGQPANGLGGVLDHDPRECVVAAPPGHPPHVRHEIRGL